jgi:hypothetical protein
MESTKEDPARGTPDRPTHSLLSDQGQQPKSPSPPSNESKVSLTEDIQLLTEDPFSSEQSKALFDAIDELRICGAGQDLDLPQVSHHSS